MSEKEVLNYTSVAEIKKRFIYDSKDNGISRSYIFGYEKDNPSYEFLKTKIFNETSTSGYNNEITIYTHNLENAKTFFKKRLQELKKEEKEIIFKKITQNLLFNIYTITSDIDVFIAFETMNNRGKPLSNLELLKNRLIYLSTKFKTEDTEKNKLRKIINDGWRGIYHYLGLNKDKPLIDDFFLNNHCSIFYGDEIFPIDEIEANRLRRLNHQLRENLGQYLLEEKFTLKNIKTKDNITIKSIKDYVESLQNSVIIWFYLFNPTLSKDFTDNEKLLLDRLNRIGLGHFSALLLAIYLKKPKNDVKIKLLENIEKLSFIYILVAYRFYVPMIDYGTIAIKVQKGEINLNELLTIIENQIKEITERTDFIDRLIDNFKSDGFYGWGGIRYFLFEYELNIKGASKTKKNKIDWNEYRDEKDDYITIEHIYPQTAKSECWKKDFGSYTSTERKKLINSLGNLLPLSKPKNSSLQNKCFVEKVNNNESYIGYKYGSYSENEISGLKEWSPKDILERGIKLLKFMEKRWNLDFKSDEKRILILNLSFLKEQTTKITIPKSPKVK
jgi:RNA binding exosome subunit